MSRPACMDDEDFTAWVALNERLRNGDRADSPCRDCTAKWHREMMAAGTCNGTPGGEPSQNKGGRPNTGPEHLRGLSLADLFVLRTYWPYRKAPVELRQAISRARWREYRRARREAVT